MSVSAPLAPTAPVRRDQSIRTAIAPRRRRANRLWWGLCSFGMLLVLVPVVWVLVGSVSRAVAVWHWSVLTTTSTGVGGGLSNLIVGSLVMTAGVAIVAGAAGIGCGVYLSEMRAPGRVTSVLRSAYEVLAGIPSIIFGYVGYIALVVGLHWGFSLLPAVIVLSALVVPYIAKATELALNQVPLAYREGAEALGMAKTHLLRRVVLRSAIPGIATGILLALAIAIGETAPLLFTAGFSNSYPSGALIHSQVGWLPYGVYVFFDDPSAAVRALSAESGFLLVVIVLLLILCSRLVVRVTQKHSPNRAMQSGGRKHQRPGSAGKPSWVNTLRGVSNR